MINLECKFTFIFVKGISSRSFRWVVGSFCILLGARKRPGCLQSRKSLTRIYKVIKKMGIYSSKSWSLCDAVLSFVLTCEENLMFSPSSMTAVETEAVWAWIVLSSDGLETILFYGSAPHWHPFHLHQYVHLLNSHQPYLSKIAHCHQLHCLRPINQLNESGLQPVVKRLKVRSYFINV
jgi:hypothetical protein